MTPIAPTLGETRAVVVVQGGRIVAERYMHGYGPTTRALSWSMAKSVTHALVGIAVRRGLVDIDKPMGNPRWAAGDARAAITWRSGCSMVDGQDYHEIGVAIRRATTPRACSSATGGSTSPAIRARRFR